MTTANWTARKMIAAGAWTACSIALVLHSVVAADVEAGVLDAIEAERAADARAERFLARLSADVVAPAAPTPALKPAPQSHQFLRAAAVDARIDVDAAPAARFVRAERDCLADAIYHEARSESVAGQLAVADVILNRRDARRYPDTICGVVYQGSERITGCQFSFTCDGSLDRRINARKRREAEGLADVVLAGLRPGVSRDATHYHAYYVDPPWAKRLTPTAEIGAHKFYRAPGEIVLAAAPLQF